MVISDFWTSKIATGGHLRKKHLQKKLSEWFEHVRTDCWPNRTWYKFTFGQYIYRQVCWEWGNIHCCSPFTANAHNSSFQCFRPNTKFLCYRVNNHSWADGGGGGGNWHNSIYFLKMCYGLPEWHTGLQKLCMTHRRFRDYCPHGEDCNASSTHSLKNS